MMKHFFYMYQSKKNTGKKLWAAALFSFLWLSYSSCSDTGVEPEVIKDVEPVMNEQDSLALLSLYNSMGGRFWGPHYQWDTERPVAEWHGVTVGLVEDEYRVLELWFSNTQEIRGTLSAAVGDLSALKLLSVTGRELTGAIPPEIGKLEDLRFLMFYITGLTGPLPKEIGNLKKLDYLEIDENPNLEGGLPAEIGQLTELTYVNVGNSEKLGGILHPEFGNLKKVDIFHVQRIGLTGTIPPELSGLNSIRSLSFADNNLTGHIPEELAKINADYIYLGSNQLEGAIPEAFGDSQISLRVARNNLNGAVPDGILNRYTAIQLNRFICPQNPGYGFTNCTPL